MLDGTTFPPSHKHNFKKTQSCQTHLAKCFWVRLQYSYTLLGVSPHTPKYFTRMSNKFNGNHFISKDKTNGEIENWGALSSTTMLEAGTLH